MMFILSMLLTSFIGYLICFRSSQHLTFIETLFISIFIGWGYFTSLVLFFSTNLPEVELSSDLLFALIVISLFVFSIPAVIIHRINVIHFIKSMPAFLNKFILKRK